VALRAKLWSLTGLATELAVNVRTISAALSKVAPDGMIDGGRHPGWFMVTALEAIGAKLPVRGHRLNKSNSAANGAGDAYYASRTTLATERAKLLRLQRQEAEGELAPIAILASELKNMALFLRGRALALPTKIAPQMVRLKTPGEARAILDREVRDWLLDIASTKIRVSRRKRPAPDWEDWIDDEAPDR
jgi:hypothetical protein